jgi:hypothetical protein
MVGLIHSATPVTVTEAKAEGAKTRATAKKPAAAPRKNLSSLTRRSLPD